MGIMPWTIAASVGAVLFSAGIAVAATTTLPGPGVGPFSSLSVSVGTNGSDADYAEVSVSQGGCTLGWISVTVGDPNRDCGTWTPSFDNPGTGDAYGLVAVGLLGAEATGSQVAVSDGSQAQASCMWYITDGCVVGIAVAPSGSAHARDLAVSGTGDATPQFTLGLIMVSGTGDAYNGFVTVAGRDANTTSYSSVAGRDASSRLVAAGGRSANANGGAVAVAGTGRASGGTVANVSVLGSSG